MASSRAGVLRPVLFLPGDPARSGVFLELEVDDGEVVLNGGQSRERVRSGLKEPPGRGTQVEVEVVLPVATPVGERARRMWVGATVRGVDDVLAMTVGPDANAARLPRHPTLTAWCAIVRAGLVLAAEGRLLPSVSPNGWDTWTAAPLDVVHTQMARDFADALPGEAHCLPVDGSGTRLVDPTAIVLQCWDAVLDHLVRTPAAEAIAGEATFARRRPVKCDHLAGWANRLAEHHAPGARLLLKVGYSGGPTPTSGAAETRERNTTSSLLDGVDPRSQPVDLEGTADEPWSVTLMLQSETDASLALELHRLGHLAPAVSSQLGPRPRAQAERLIDAAARCWAPLARLAPGASKVVIDDDELDELVRVAPEIEQAGAVVEWPAELSRSTVSRRLFVDADTGDGVGGFLGLKHLLQFRWELILDGEVLSPDDVAVLAEAKRPLVAVGGRWVRLDDRVRRLLGERPPRMLLAQVLAAALSEQLTLFGGSVTGEEGGHDVRLGSGIRELIGRLADPAAAELGEPLGFVGELRGYQREGVGWLADRVALGTGACLADDMGLGKTIQLIALHLHLRASGEQRPCLVVCPTSLLPTWEREFARFAPGVSVLRHHGVGRRSSAIRGADVVLTTYGVVRRDIDELEEFEFGLAIADEAQALKNPRSGVARAVRRRDTGSRIACTGTPIENRLAELWALMDWTTPGLLGGLDRFRRQIGIPVEQSRDPGATDQLRRLVRPFILRRLKTDPGVAPDLPERIEIDRHVALTTEQVTLYEAAVREGLAAVRESSGIGRRGLVLGMLTSLKQITNHPAHRLGQDGPLAGRSGKLGLLEELVASAGRSGEKMLVFTHFTAMGNLITSHLTVPGRQVEFLHGGLGVGQRQSLVDRFQAGEIDVLVMSLKAGGVGLTLTRATQVVHYDRWWNPAVEDQASDRAHRIGQVEVVTIHRLISVGTLEERIADLLAAKRSLADRVVGGDSWLSELSDEQLERLVGLGPPAGEGSAMISTVGAPTGPPVAASAGGADR